MSIDMQKRFDEKIKDRVFAYKGQQYRVMQLVQMRVPMAGVWAAAYLYQPVSDTTKSYVRVAADFEAKFEEVKNA